jgi:WD40 repeat protein
MIYIYIYVLIAHTDGIWTVTWNETANKILTGSVDTKVKVWDSETVSCRQTLTGHKLAVISLDADSSGTCRLYVMIDLM